MKSAFGIRRKKATNASSPKSLNGPASWLTERPVGKQRAKSSWALEGALEVAAEEDIKPPAPAPAPALAHAT